MIIRKANPSDISTLSQIIRESYTTVALKFELTLENCPKHPSNCTDSWVENDYERGVTYYLAEVNNSSIGCAALEKANDHTCYLERLAVLPEFRREGVGLKLLKHVLSTSQAMGFQAIGIGIISQQEDLKNWYRKIGFNETGRKTFSHLPFEVAFMEYNIQNQESIL